MKLENTGMVNDTASSANPILAKPFDAGTSSAVACARSWLLGQGNNPTNTTGVVTSDYDPEAVRRTLVQKCMKGPVLSAKEKQGKIQELMGLGTESILAAATAAAAEYCMPDNDDEMALDDVEPASVPMDTTVRKPKQGAPLKTENHRSIVVLIISNEVCLHKMN